MTDFTVAIVGRPNVGKSSLFNRLIGKKHAIVDDFAGVTRDWREGKGKIGPLNFNVIDTAGLEQEAKDDLSKKIKQVTLDALEHAHLILFVVDAKVGICNEDINFAKWLRKSDAKIALIANKAESSESTVYVQDYFKLGLGEPVFISAQHGQGMVDLFDTIDHYMEDFQSKQSTSEAELDAQESISLAIVGRPNAGKSTLVNFLLKKERMVTGDMPGITRDSIALDYEFNGKNIKLVDTAGIKKRTSIKDELEEITYEDSKRAIRFAHVVILTIDAGIAFEKQDIAIANMAISEGRGLVVAINKWDLVKDKSRYNNALVDSMAELLPEVKDAPIIYISAINGHNVNKLVQAALESYDNWNIRIPTRKLNEWLAQKIAAHPLPLGVNSKRIKIKYITQHNTRPPSFVLFCNLPDDLNESYIRYLRNSLKEDFSLYGVPVRLHCKKVDNPYLKK
jgi:GTPase